MLIARNLVGGVFQFGFHYRLAGFEVWGGEILASVSVLLAAGLLLSVSKRWAARLQAFLALVLLGGAALAFAAVLRRSGGLSALSPGFVPGNDRLAAQVLGVAALAPWAFVGFESVSHSAEGFRFKRRRMFLLMAAALAASLFVYVALAAVAAAIRPEGFADWPAYVKALPKLSGVDALPVFHAVETAMGPTGVYILGATTLAAILTGVLGFLTAASRLLVAVSCLIPFVGRTAIGWIVDGTTIGASVAYGYVSWCALSTARLERRLLPALTGVAGIAASVAFPVYCLAPPSPAEREEAVASILASSRTLLGIVDDILDLSRLESGQLPIDPLPVDAPALFRETAGVFADDARKAGLDFRLSVSPMPRLLLDPVRLRQIVFNLVGNAVKFTEKGFIEVRASFAPAPGALGGTLLLEVEDSGIGIAEEDIPRITTAYVQLGAKLARNGGTGLGLAICRHLATAMDGTFHVRSALGRGTTITLSFPRIKIAEEAPPAPQPAPAAAQPSLPSQPSQESQASQESQPSHPAPAPSHRILLVDDSKMNLMVLKALLKRLGTFDIATAADGNEALALLRDPSAPPFALVLTDYWMPNLDGAGLVSAIRADPALSSLPVHVVTADVELQPTYASLGFDSLLLKPVTPDTLRPLLPS